MTVSVEQRIADELQVQLWQVVAAIGLLDDGATVPFVARYRKEVTGTLDDAQLRTLQERLAYLRELEKRREAILESIGSQGKLTPELEAQVREAETKSRLEDIYMPYKTKRRTKAQIAREAGLAPLASGLLADPSQDPKDVAAQYVDAEKGVADVSAALEGARSILVETFSEDADLIGTLRERMWNKGRLAATVREGKEAAGAKYSDYFALTEAYTKLPSHRVLAMFRGEKEEILDLNFEPDDEAPPAPGEFGASERFIAHRFGITNQGRPGDKFLTDAVRWAWRTRISVHLGLDVRSQLRTAAEEEAIRVFAANLRDLLLAAPAGNRATMGLDPGIRTGVKVAIVDGTGKVVAHSTIYPHEPRRRWAESLDELEKLARAHHVDLIAIGNGTASRETDKLAAELIARASDLNMTKVVVSEAGASVYSASAYASAELPDLDVSIRGAVSIARRLQDPLAELVKIDPKSIGVGQYQHDLPESSLARSLDGVVEFCVNAVGVDVNTASAPLLRQVSGIGETLAANIVSHRDANGPFTSRKSLRNVPLLGAKAFEQSAGFLRIQGGDDPLDASGVHPEAYPLVRRILTKAEVDLPKLIGNTALIRSLKPGEFADDTFGLPTVEDILAELDKPGRDPRPAFKAAVFADGVNTVTDLRPAMVLEGVVTNVAAFGAFVDVGVHQDGLVHVSAMSNKFVSDPREVVKPGDVVKVKVMEVDVDRKRISLSLRLDDEIGAPAGGGRGARGGGNGDRGQRSGGGQGRGGQGGQGGQPGQGGRGGQGSQGGRGGQGGPGGRGGQAGQGSRGGQGGQGGQNGGRGGQGGGRSGASVPDTALADALRRAGLLNT
ncbi:Tex family protein [Kineosporia sp. NBRC 101731]|uniref:Tex family protein n=1 Tax=Kineosporia sp. NBRC 101731 TaxID=3032199 RepID=UPI0024A04CE7|nr:Tex family protein [Kineosporia sp. NBRC 101731]GLY31719.1 RNA-binding transcriptional accessory protein [Kineosporia sp. NBRC 101731]